MVNQHNTTAFTDDQLRVMVQWHRRGYKATEIAKRVGQSRQAVVFKLKQLGHMPKARNDWTVDQDSLIEELSEENLTDGEIAERFEDRTENAVKARRLKLGIHKKRIQANARERPGNLFIVRTNPEETAGRYSYWREIFRQRHYRLFKAGVTKTKKLPGPYAYHSRGDRKFLARVRV